MTKTRMSSDKKLKVKEVLKDEGYIRTYVSFFESCCLVELKNVDDFGFSLLKKLSDLFETEDIKVRCTYCDRYGDNDYSIYICYPE